MLNVGAGTGSYEPADRDMIAVEPSAVMIAQRRPGSAPVIQAAADALPFDDDSVDAAMAIVTDHHWSDRLAGMQEMLRVATNRVLVVNTDPALAERFWMTRDSLPCFMDLVPERYREPGYWSGELRELLGDIEIEPVRNSISVFHWLPGDEVSSAMEKLEWDLDNDLWKRRNRDLLELSALDVGLRLAVCML